MIESCFALSNAASGSGSLNKPKGHDGLFARSPKGFVQDVQKQMAVFTAIFEEPKFTFEAYSNENGLGEMLSERSKES